MSRYGTVQPQPCIGVFGEKPQAFKSLGPLKVSALIGIRAQHSGSHGKAQGNHAFKQSHTTRTKLGN